MLTKQRLVVDNTSAMSMLSENSKRIRQFVVKHVERHPQDIVRLAAAKFGISRQAVHRHLASLIAEGTLCAEGSTRRRQYRLGTQSYRFNYDIIPGIEEDRIWKTDVRPILARMAPNVRDICEYGLLEMLNNAIDHSAGKTMAVVLEYSSARIEIQVADDGIGIFAKLQRQLGLQEPEDVALELMKGKLTTDPKRHSGEGIFFTSRMFDSFSIHSGGFTFLHTSGNDWTFQATRERPGTQIAMNISQRSKRTMKDVFDRFSSEESDYQFATTEIPVNLARSDEGNLVSRSQAKRLLARVDKFREVIFDFAGVQTVGQAFADEIFRVFQNEHPEIKLTYTHAATDVEKMIRRAIHHVS